jgi:hypothetical protein
MPKLKQTANFSDIHKRQLFHWVGGNIDVDLRARKLTASDVREKYLTYLKDDLQNGLPIKSPKVPEKLACDGVEIPLNLPMACFTEWSLSESRPHSSRYGRMALGFSKPWIIKHGGQPVTYFNHTQKGLFLKTMVALHDFVRRLKEPTPVPGLKASEIEAAFKRALYLLHFAKPFAAPLKRRRPKPKLMRPPIRKPAPAERPAALRPATRYFGPVLEFLEEREWRIVRHNKPYFVKDPVGLFDSRLRFDLGSELFTLMLPDNELVKMVWSDKSLRNRLLKAPVPVSVLSFQDIGTF